MSGIAYLNGVFVARDAAAVGIDDGGYLHGAALFETMRAEYGRIFRLESHLARLMRSAARILGPLERPALPAAEAFEELLVRNGLASARVRMTVSTTAVPLDGRAAQEAPADGRGSTQEALPDGRGSGSRRGAANYSGGSAEETLPDGRGSAEDTAGVRRWTVCATAEPLVGYGESAYRDGIRVMIARRAQPTDDPLAGHKTTCYLPRLLALRAAHAAHCGEALFFTPDHHLAEGAVSNVFIAAGGVLRTPPLSTPVLPGIARGVVLEAARAAGMTVDDEHPITIDHLLDADEVFLTNVIMQVLPVIGVEKRPVAGGRPGPAAAELLGAFRRAVQRECQG